MTRVTRARRAGRRGRLAVVLLVMSLVAHGCGRSPAGPDAAHGLRLTTGLQTVTLVGQDFSSDPEYPPCTNLRAPIGGKMVSTAVVLEQSGREWVAHSAAGAGALQIRFHETQATDRDTAFEGTVEGWAVDVTDILHQSTGVKVTITDTDGTATLTARALRGMLRIDGRIAGLSTFTDAAGRGGNCQAISFAMMPTAVR